MADVGWLGKLAGLYTHEESGILSQVLRNDVHDMLRCMLLDMLLCENQAPEVRHSTAQVAQASLPGMDRTGTWHLHTGWCTRSQELAGQQDDCDHDDS